MTTIADWQLADLNKIEDTNRKMEKKLAQLEVMVNDLRAKADSAQLVIQVLTETNATLTGQIYDLRERKFPVNMRKTWTGEEVQQWLKERNEGLHQYATTP